MAIPEVLPLPDQRRALVDAEIAADAPATTATSVPVGPMQALVQGSPRTEAPPGIPGYPSQGPINPNSGFPTSAPAAPPGASGLPAPSAPVNPASGFPTPAGPPAPPAAQEMPHAIPEVQVSGSPAPTPVLPPGVQSIKTSYSGPAPGSDYQKHLDAYNQSVTEGDRLYDEQAALQVADKRAAAGIKDSAVQEAERRQADFDKQYEYARQHMASLGEKRDALIDQLSRYELDPDKYLKSQNAMQSFNTGIGLMVGGMLQGGGFTNDNPALTQLNTAINRQIDADKLALSTRLKALDGLTDAQRIEMQDSAEVRVMQGARREAYWDMVGRRLDSEAAKRGVDITSKQFEQAKNLVQQQRNAAAVASDRARLEAAMKAAAARAAQDRADRLKALELALQKGKESGGDSNVIMDQGAFLGAIQGTPRMIKDKDGNLIPMPLPVIEKGGLGGLGDMWKTNPEQASKLQLAARTYATGLNAYDRYVELMKKSVGGVNLSPAEAAEKDHYRAVLSSVGKQPGENSDLDLEIRERRNIPSHWESDKALLDHRMAFEATLAGGLPPQLKQEALSEFGRLRNARVAK